MVCIETDREYVVPVPLDISSRSDPLITSLKKNACGVACSRKSSREAEARIEFGFAERAIFSEFRCL